MTRTNIPAPFYAAAGAGDLAYRRLRKLSTSATRVLRDAGLNPSDLRQRVAGQQRSSLARLDLATLRASARRGGEALGARAFSAQERAISGYHRLVAHGERVVSERTRASGPAPAEDPARIESTSRPAPSAAPPEMPSGAAGPAVPDEPTGRTGSTEPTG